MITGLTRPVPWGGPPAREITRTGDSSCQSSRAGASRCPIQDYLEQLHARCLELRDGEVATYIPELAKADPDWFGISLATSDGRVYEVGDTRRPFTIQSISKPFVYGLALEDRGARCRR